MKVDALTIDKVINNAFDGRYQIPTFQRDFKWKADNIIKFAESVLQGLPCGSIVIWDPINSPNIKSEPIRVPLSKRITSKTQYKYFGSKIKPKQYKIVIDGRQRITSLALIFGGFSGNDGIEGKYFIDMNALNINGSISFMTSSEIIKNKFDQEEKWLASGLFPLSTFENSQNQAQNNRFLAHWSYLYHLIKTKGTKNQNIRNQEIQDFVGQTVLAELEISHHLSVADVAQSFEVLNTEGQKVQLVDILHALLSGYYSKKYNKDFNFRAWIEKIGTDKKTSHGWGISAEKDGHLISQLVISTDLFLETRKGSRKSKYKPESIRKKDIVALNEEHWNDVITNKQLFCEALYKFQFAVLGTQFPKSDAPYPISACLYVGLYWKMKVEKLKWDQSRFDKIYKAYFWITVLTNRFTTDSFGVVDDMKQFIELMNLDDSNWFIKSNDWLSQIKSQYKIPSVKTLEKYLLIKPKSNNSPDGPSGAFKDALLLAVKHKPTKDILSINTNISYPASYQKIEMHHIFPKKWITKNEPRMGIWNSKNDIIEKKDCIANLTPLLINSNALWGDKSPATFIQDLNNGAQKKGKPVWTERFIDDDCYDALVNDDPVIFLMKRAKNIANWVHNQTILSK